MHVGLVTKFHMVQAWDLKSARRNPSGNSQRDPENVMVCRVLLQVLLFDWNLGYPWAKTENNGPHHPNITRVSDWAAVETMLRVLAMAEQPR